MKPPKNPARRPAGRGRRTPFEKLKCFQPADIHGLDLDELIAVLTHEVETFEALLDELQESRVAPADE